MVNEKCAGCGKVYYARRGRNFYGFHYCSFYCRNKIRRKLGYRTERWTLFLTKLKKEKNVNKKCLENPAESIL